MQIINMSPRYILNTIQIMKLLVTALALNIEAIEGFIDSINETINFKKCS
jgi:hypothetical protein